ncbi:MAG: hypothetical protein B6U89_00615 [Desulfurococcales archaeon ex4484_58]|nr:MAG: hypothetical protein B6U89_00615 [Desulfurococcales archaeon ex4484_58]
MSYFSAKELINSDIYDSEGLYYGTLCGLEIGEKPKLKACLIFDIGEYIPDVERLKEKLRERGLEIPEDITLEELVVTARTENIDIPVVEVEKRIEFTKGFLSLDEIRLVDIVYKPGRGNNWRVGVIMLEKPREAVYRGLPTPTSTPYLELLDKVIDKLVVSLSDGIIGYVQDIVFAPKDVGIRVEAVNYRSGNILWNNYLALLEARGYKELVELLRGSIKPAEKLDLNLYGYIHSLLYKYKAPIEAYELLNSNIEFEEMVIEKYRDISWKNVLKVGDIVIVK